VQLERLDLPEAWFARLATSHAAGGMLSQEAAPALGLGVRIVLETGDGNTPCAALGSDLAALAPGTTRVAGPQNDTVLAGCYARFTDLYGRVETWFAAPGVQ
jgi:hypothetical protein